MTDPIITAIAVHKAAWQEEEAACIARDRFEHELPREVTSDVYANINGRNACSHEEIDEIMDSETVGCPATMVAKARAEAHAAFDAALADQKAKRDAAGLTPFIERHEAAVNASDEALIAVCESVPCSWVGAMALIKWLQLNGSELHAFDHGLHGVLGSLKAGLTSLGARPAVAAAA